MKTPITPVLKTKLTPDLLISCKPGAALIVCVAALMGAALLASAPERTPPESGHLFVTAGASALVTEGLAAAAPTGTEAESFQEVPSPGLRFVANVAQATTSPWIDSNAWRYHRGLRKANYSKLAAGAGPLAAAEAFAFGVDAILNPEPADLEELRRCCGS